MGCVLDLSASELKEVARFVGMLVNLYFVEFAWALNDPSTYDAD